MSHLSTLSKFALNRRCQTPRDWTTSQSRSEEAWTGTSFRLISHKLGHQKMSSSVLKSTTSQASNSQSKNKKKSQILVKTSTMARRKSKNMRPKIMKFKAITLTWWILSVIWAFQEQVKILQQPLNRIKASRLMTSSTSRFSINQWNQLLSSNPFKPQPTHRTTILLLVSLTISLRQHLLNNNSRFHSSKPSQ